MCEKVQFLRQLTNRYTSIQDLTVSESSESIVVLRNGESNYEEIGGAVVAVSEFFGLDQEYVKLSVVSNPVFLSQEDGSYSSC